MDEEKDRAWENEINRQQEYNEAFHHSDPKDDNNNLF